MEEGKEMKEILEDLDGVPEDAESAPEEESGPEGLSPTAVANILGENFDGKHVRRLLRAGTMKGTKVEGRWTVTEEQVEDYMVFAAEKAAAKIAEEEAAKEIEGEIEEVEDDQGVEIEFNDIEPVTYRT